MGLFDWLKSLKPKRETPPEVAQARELAIRIAEKAQHIQEGLKVYQRAKNPFAAMMADLHTRHEVSNIWRNGGPS